MSKYIPTDKKPKGQVKPKLKVKVLMNQEEKVLNEYDAFQMISDLNVRQSQMEKIIGDMSQALKGITDAMQAATEVTDVNGGTPVNYTGLKLPKLKTQSSTLDAPKNIYPNAADKVKLQS